MKKLHEENHCWLKATVLSFAYAEVFPIFHLLTSVLHWKMILCSNLLAERNSPSRLQQHGLSPRTRICTEHSCGNSNFVSLWRSKTHPCLSATPWKEMKNTTENENEREQKRGDSHFIHHSSCRFHLPHLGPFLHINCTIWPSLWRALHQQPTNVRGSEKAYRWISSRQLSFMVFLTGRWFQEATDPWGSCISVFSLSNTHTDSHILFGLSGQ